MQARRHGHEQILGLQKIDGFVSTRPKRFMSLVENPRYIVKFAISLIKCVSKIFINIFLAPLFQIISYKWTMILSCLIHDVWLLWILPGNHMHCGQVRNLLSFSSSKVSGKQAQNYRFLEPETGTFNLMLTKLSRIVYLVLKVILLITRLTGFDLITQSWYLQFLTASADHYKHWIKKKLHPSIRSAIHIKSMISSRSVLISVYVVSTDYPRISRTWSRQIPNLYKKHPFMGYHSSSPK